MDRDDALAQQYVDAWTAAGMELVELPTDGGRLLIVGRGARVVPFDDAGRPLLWLSDAVGPGADVAAWARSSAWNLGGERLWIGPEFRLMVEDRNDFHGTYRLGPAMDPGAWEFGGEDRAAASPSVARQRPERVTLTHEMRVVASQPRAHLALGVTQRIAVLADPARRWPESQALRHLGWSREAMLTRLADDDGSVACQAWVLGQVIAPGTVTVPGAAAATVTDYFEPVDDSLLRRENAALALAITGDRRYKVGVRTGEHRGAVVYRYSQPGGYAVLLARFFSDTPSSGYLEEPPRSSGHEGDSVYVYNDDGSHGGFGEVEALGRALEPGASSVTDVFEMHAWWGEAGDVERLYQRMYGR